jgi:hypothetical protein
MGDMTHFGSYSVENGDIKVRLSLKRFDEQFKKAQTWLDMQVMTDMVPYMPHETGTFVNLTRAQSAAIAGTGKVVAGAPPMGRFLYHGKVMVDPVTNSPWARPGAKKVVTERPLTYSNPKATAYWFDTAKQNHGKAWVKNVKKLAGGGTIG